MPDTVTDTVTMSTHQCVEAGWREGRSNPMTVNDIPKYSELIVPTFKALKALGGSGKNDEILNQVIEREGYPDEMVDIPHGETGNMTELAYRISWARFYLGKYGAIENSARGVWAIRQEYLGEDAVDPNEIVKAVHAMSKKSPVPATSADNNDIVDSPDELEPWREELSNILHTMDPYGFERLCKRILREYGFDNVEVTKKSGDGGIDGNGKFKLNGIFSFNVAFQCKRYKDSVGAGEIRDFRGSLTTDIEKGLFITTGSFTKTAKEEASNPGKQQIDLVDGEELINMIVKCGLGVKPVTTYEIDEEFFEKI